MFLVLLMSYLKNYCQTQGHENLPLCFSSESCIVLALKFRLLINFQLIFVWCQEKIYFHSLGCGHTFVAGQFVEKSILSPLNGRPSVKLIHHRCMGLFLDFEFCFIGLYASTTMFWLLYAMKLGSMLLPTLFFFFKIIFVI